MKKKKDELNKKNNDTKKQFDEIAKKINGKSLIFKKEAKDNGDLYGSIKPKEISLSFLENLKIEVKPSQIILKTDIDKVGDYIIDINLHSEVSTQIKITVSKEDANK